MNEKKIDLENGYELVVEGSYKTLNYCREIFAMFGSGRSVRIYIRQNKEKEVK